MRTREGRPQWIEIKLEPHGGIRGRCSQCQRPAPGYDRLAERRWQSVPLWGIPTYFCYAPRRVECGEHGVIIEHLPWSEGKRRVTCAMMVFLARWARRLSWRETAQVFGTSWEAVPKNGGPAKQFVFYDLEQIGGLWLSRQVEAKLAGKPGSTILLIDHGSPHAHLTRKDFNLTAVDSASEAGR